MIHKQLTMTQSPARRETLFPVIKIFNIQNKSNSGQNIPMSGSVFTLPLTTQLQDQECRYTLEERTNKNLQRITSMFSNHIPKQFKREKIVSSSLDDFIKLLFTSSDLQFLYTFGGKTLMIAY